MKIKIVLAFAILGLFLVGCDRSQEREASNAALTVFAPTLTPSKTPTTTNTPIPSNTPIPTNTPPPTQTPTATPIQGSLYLEGDTEYYIMYPGTYQAESVVITDTLNHDFRIQFPEDFNMDILTETIALTETGAASIFESFSLEDITVYEQPPQKWFDVIDIILERFDGEFTPLHFEGESPWVDLEVIQSETGVLLGFGRGTVAGYPNIDVRFAGSTADNFSFSGILAMGYGGGLPGNAPAFYQISAEIEDFEENAANEESVDYFDLAVNFASKYSAAIQTGDSDFLYNNIHPVVLQKYGPEQCQAYVSQFNEPEFKLELHNVLDSPAPSDWIWERDGFSQLLTNTLTVSSTLTTQGYVISQESHFVLLEDGQFSWVTDCGDPVE